MRRLTLVRHASAEPKAPRSTDFERALDRRGEIQAQATARRILALEPTPDLMLVSSALRARQTARTLACELGLAPQHIWHDARLYLATAADMLSLIEATDPQAQHLMIVGHNPGISELARLLASQAARDLETAALCTMSFDADTWSEIAPGAAREVRYESPPARLEL